MTSFLVTFLVMVVVIAIMSVGVIFGRKPVQGSCGGMTSIEGMSECEICGGKPEECEKSDGRSNTITAGGILRD